MVRADLCPAPQWVHVYAQEFCTRSFEPMCASIHIEIIIQSEGPRTELLLACGVKCPQYLLDTGHGLF